MTRLERIRKFVVHEFLEVLPPTLFCLIFFHVILFNTQLILSEFGVDLEATLKVTLIALVVGKVVVIVDKFPFIRRLDRRPLVVPIVFKAFVFTLFVTLVRLAEPWVPAFYETLNIAAANKHVSEHYTMRMFTAAQIWIFISFIIYFTASEIFTVFDFSRAQLLRAFFHRHPLHMTPDVRAGSIIEND